MYFELYQVKDIAKCDYAFMPYSYVEKLGMKVDIEDYKRVAYGSGVYTLDEVYEIFNLDLPETYKGRSASVSDLICVDDTEWFYIDSIGFKKIGDFSEQTFDGKEFRICDVCGSVMVNGYMTDDGFIHYCSEECLHRDYTPEEYLDAYLRDEVFYTEWY